MKCTIARENECDQWQDTEKTLKYPGCPSVLSVGRRGLIDTLTCMFVPFQTVLLLGPVWCDVKTADKYL